MFLHSIHLKTHAPFLSDYPMIESYFQNEKRHGYFCVAVGLAALLLFLIPFFIQVSPLFSGMGIPLGFLLVICLNEGIQLLYRSDRQGFFLDKKLAANPAEFVEMESGRMNDRLFQLRWFKWVGVISVTASIIQFIWANSLEAGYATHYAFGRGLGLVLVGAIVTLLFSVAEKRAKVYNAFVHTLLQPSTH